MKKKEQDEDEDPYLLVHYIRNNLFVWFTFIPIKYRINNLLTPL